MTARASRTEVLLAASLALAATVRAETYTWLASPASASWNTSALNWTVNGTDSVAWVDGNDAVFPATSSQKSISISGGRIVNNVTINGASYTLTGSPVVTGKFTANKGCVIPNCFGGNSVRIGGVSTATIYMGTGGTPTLKTLYLEDTVTIAPNNALCFGPAPASLSTNIVADGPSPTIFANGKLNLGSTRLIRIASGKGLVLGAAGSHYLKVNGPIKADPTDGDGFSKNTAVFLKYYSGWGGPVTFDPGDGVTNDLGRLQIEGSLTIASGVTRLGSSANWAAEEGAPLYMLGGGAYSSAQGCLTITGGELYIPQSSRYLNISKNAQIHVIGGKFIAPGSEALLGLGQAGSTLSVSNNGVFAVNALRIGQSASFRNVINLGRDGVIRTGKLKIETANNQNVTFNFDGGRIQSNVADDSSSTLFAAPTNAKWDGVKFYVREGGAVLDSSFGRHVWWARPLVSGAEHDGGLTCIMGGNKDVVLCSGATCSYNGPTRTEGSGSLQCRVANALPSSTTLQIGPGTTIGFNSAWAGAANNLEQTVARVEGRGTVAFNSELAVTGGVSPVFDGTYGTLTFNYLCSLFGTYDIVGDANGCGCVKVAAGQNISGLELKAGDMASMSNKAPTGTYKILDAPGGYTGAFSLAADFPQDKWRVKYGSDAVYLEPVNAFYLIVR